MQKTLGSLIVTVYVIGAFALIAYVVFFALIHHTEISKDPGDWGTLGDYFGGLLNPVISFATLVVAYAVWKQQKVELLETKVALEKQAETAVQSRREQRFFDLLKIYHQSLSMLEHNSPSLYHDSNGKLISIPAHEQRTSGKMAIEKWLFHECTGSRNLLNFAKTYGRKDITQVAQKAIISKNWINKDGYMHFGSYLRTIEQLLNITRSVFSSQDSSERVYIDLFKAQLSDGELILIGYFLWLDGERAKSFLEHAKYFGLLSNLIEGDLRSALQESLPKEVFTSNVMLVDVAH